MDMDEKTKIEYLLQLVLVLEKVADRSATTLGKPILLLESGMERYRYSDPTSLHYQVLKCVRVVSGLNACLILLKQGYVQEIGVLIRTVTEFLNDIDYVQEAHETRTPTIDQKKCIADFFEDDLKEGERLVAEGKQPARVGRNKVMAAIARSLSSVADYDRVRRLVGTIERTYSKHVHGAYPCIMELYRGRLKGGDEGFEMKGLCATEKIKTYRRAIAMQINHSFNTFAIVAQNCKLNGLFDELIEMRKTLDKSPAYD